MTITDAGGGNGGGGGKGLDLFFTKMQPRKTYKTTKPVLFSKKNTVSTTTSNNTVTTIISPTTTTMAKKNKRNKKNDTKSNHEQHKENKKPIATRSSKRQVAKKQQLKPQHTVHFIKTRRHQLHQLRQEQKEKLENYPAEGSTSAAKRYTKYQQVLKDQQLKLERQQLEEDNMSHLTFEEQIYLELYGSKSAEEASDEKQQKPVYMRKGPAMWPDQAMFEGGHIRQEDPVTATNMDYNAYPTFTVSKSEAKWNCSRRSTAYVKDLATSQGRAFFKSMAALRPNEPEQMEIQNDDHKQYAVRHSVTVSKASRKKSQSTPKTKRTDTCNKEENEILLLSHTEVGELMDSIYPESHWREIPACQALYQSLFNQVNDIESNDADDKEGDLENRENGWDQLPWTEKQRPTSSTDLLMDQRAHNYILEWLQQLKVYSSISEEEETKRATGHKAKRRRRHQQESSPELALDGLTLYDEEDEDSIDDEWVYPLSPSQQEETDGGDSDFEMGTTKKKKQRKRVRKDQSNNKKVKSNLMLIFGPHGVGKTTSVYTAAQQMGYEVFELNPGMRRTGKDLMASVGEMTNSHQVNFHEQTAAPSSLSSQQQSSEPIVDKSQKNISNMFQKIASPKKRSQVETEPDSTSNKKRRMIKEELFITSEKKSKSISGGGGSSITSHFTRTKTSTETPMKEEVESDEGENDMDYKMHHEEAASPKQVTRQSLTPTKQSLILLEEVDLLYEEDKGFWTAVLELAQKSKRPIVMTCNDTDMVPTETMKLEKAIEIYPQTTHSLIPYLQLVCFKEGYAVNPMDLLYLVASIGSDLRQLIHTLEVWCKQHTSTMIAETRNSGAQRTISQQGNSMVARRKNTKKHHAERMTDENFTKEGMDPHYQKEFCVCPRIFNQYMGIDSQDLVSRMTTMETERDDPNLLELCQLYQQQHAFTDNTNGKEKGIDGKLFTVKHFFNSSDLGIIFQGLDTMAFSDTWITRQSNQCQVMMKQANPSEVKDQICGYQGTIQMIGNQIEPELYEIENRIQQLNMKRVVHRKWQVEIQQGAGIWGGLCHHRTTTFNESIEATKKILNWRLTSNPVCNVIMTEYVPYIRAMCQMQQEMESDNNNNSNNTNNNNNNNNSGRRKRALLRKNRLFNNKINDECIEVLLQRKKLVYNLTHQWHAQATVYNDRWKDAAKGKQKAKNTQKNNGT